jgi:hypothetical protein
VSVLRAGQLVTTIAPKNERALYAALEREPA